MLGDGICRDPTCRQTDEVLIAIANEVASWASIHLVLLLTTTTRESIGRFSRRWGQVDVEEVSEFNAKYELYDPCTVMFFFKNKVKLNAVRYMCLMSVLCVGHLHGLRLWSMPVYQLGTQGL